MAELFLSLCLGWVGCWFLIGFNMVVGNMILSELLHIICLHYC